MDLKFTLGVRRLGGFSIVEVVVASGIMSIIFVAMMAMISNQNKEVAALDEKMAFQSLQTQVMSLFSSSSYCGCFIGGNTFNYSASPQNWNTFPTAIGSSYDSGCASVGGALLTVGTNLSNTIKPVALEMQNIVETTAGSGNFSGTLVIKFDQSLLTRARKNVSIPMYFRARMSDPPNARSIQSCSSGGEGILSSYDPVLLQIIIPRNGTGAISTLPGQYKFCFLTSVQSGGNDGGGQDRCEVAYDSNTKRWTLSGRRGNDPGIICKAYCVQP